MATFLDAAFVRRDVLLDVIIRSKGYTESERFATASFFELNERAENLRAAYEALGHVQMDIMTTITEEQRAEQNQILTDTEEMYIKAMATLRGRIQSVAPPPNVQSPIFFAPVHPYVPPPMSQSSLADTVQEPNDELDGQNEQVPIVNQPTHSAGNDTEMPPLVPAERAEAQATDTLDRAGEHNTQEQPRVVETSEVPVEQPQAGPLSTVTSQDKASIAGEEQSKGAVPKTTNVKTPLTATIAPEGGTIKWKRLEEEAAQLQENMCSATKSLIGLSQIKLTPSLESYDAVLSTLRRAADTLAVARANLQGYERLLAHLLVVKLPMSIYKKWPIDYDNEDMPSLAVVEGFMVQEVEALRKAATPNETSAARTDTPESRRPLTCHNCGQAHTIFRCPDFLDLTVPQRKARANELWLCLNCFSNMHQTGSSSCKSGPCCGALHNSLLCTKEGDQTPELNENKLKKPWEE